MWELLQKLEDLWWKPYWKSIAELTGTEKNVRLLTSLSSWLWQFVCDNKLLNTTDWEYERRLKKASDCWWDGSEYNTKNDGWYEYRVIESALKDESELEGFLLNSIKLD